MRLLLAEDDPMIGEAVRRGLAQDGFAVDWVRDGHAAELALAEKVHELLLLDLGLPRKEGLDVLAAMRRGGDRAAGAGADRARRRRRPRRRARRGRRRLPRQAVRARPSSAPGSVRSPAGRLAEPSPGSSWRRSTIDPATHEVSVDGVPLALSAREYALLEALAARPGAILSRAQLEERLYGWKEAVDSNAVDVHLSTLRRKLPPGTIRNVRGMGWMLPRPPRTPA